MKLQKVSGRRSMQIIVSVISTEAFFSLIKSVGQRVVCSCSPSFCDAFDRCADLVLLFFWWAFRLTFRSHWFTNTTKKKIRGEVLCYSSLDDGGLGPFGVPRSPCTQGRAQPPSRSACASPSPGSSWLLLGPPGSSGSSWVLLGSPGSSWL